MIVIGKMAVAVCILTVQGCVHDDRDKQGSCSWIHDASLQECLEDCVRDRML